MKRPRNRLLCRLVAATLAILMLGGLVAEAAVRPVRLPPNLARLKLPPAFATQLQRTKQRADMAKVQRAHVLRAGIILHRETLAGRVREIPLISLAIMDKDTFAPGAEKAGGEGAARQEAAAASAAAKNIPTDMARMRAYIMSPTIMARLVPSGVDHRSRQSPIRDQDNRGTCVAHGSLACLEAMRGMPRDLSEQYAHHYYMVREGKLCRDDRGLVTTHSAPYLRHGVPEERSWPYQTLAQLRATPHATHMAQAASAARRRVVRVTRYHLILNTGLTGASIKNPRYLEALLNRGYDIVWGTYVAWTTSSGVIDVTLDSRGNPISPWGGHCMLIVGYNRLRKYFIVKNSWGTGFGHAGYGYFHYDYLKTYAKYGYIVTGVQRMRLPVIRPPIRGKIPIIKKPIPIKKLEPKRMIEPIRKN